MMCRRCRRAPCVPTTTTTRNSRIVPSAWSEFGFDWMWVNPITGKLWVDDFSYSGGSYTHAIRIIDTTSDTVAADLNSYPSDTYLIPREGFAFNPSLNQVVISEGGAATPRLMTFNATTGAFVSSISNHPYAWLRANPYSDVMFASSINNDYIMFKLNPDLSIAATWDHLATPAFFSNNLGFVFSSANSGWHVNGTDILEFDLTTGVATSRYTFPVPDGNWHALEVIGSKLWVVLAGSNTVASFDVGTSTFTQYTMPDSAPPGGLQYYANRLTGEILYYRPEAGQPTKLVAWDTVTHAQVQSQLIGVGSAMGIVTTTAPCTYWPEYSPVGGSILHEWCTVTTVIPCP
jgi:hypothetical protein